MKGGRFRWAYIILTAITLLLVFVLYSTYAGLRSAGKLTSYGINAEGARSIAALKDEIHLTARPSYAGIELHWRTNFKVILVDDYFAIFRKKAIDQNQPGWGERLGTVQTKGLKPYSFIDTTPKQGEKYSYMVVAIQVSGASEIIKEGSNTVEVMSPAAP